MMTNTHLKQLCQLHNKKYRNIEKQLLVEGIRLIEQIAVNGIEIIELFCLEHDAAKLDYLNPQKTTICRKWQLEKLAQTQSPQPVIALVAAKRKPLPESNLLLYLDRIADPGNLGTIFRTAAGLGYAGIITSPGCCELYNPKAVRSSMGAVLSLPSAEHDAEWLINSNKSIIVTCLDDAVDMRKLSELPEPAVLVIGSEAHGASKNLIENSDLRALIPMNKEMESLNASVAAGIIMFYIKHGILRD